ncbi:hypothetical protein [Psychrobacillus sp. FSL H8-0487]|uniref:hypothetical protein n=1 Tax=Psychrobacillus sp. FSL H8-0487 TaxID=2921391 RepID=UPI0030F6A89A
MTNKFVLRGEIEKFLEILSISRVDRFYPTALSKYLNIPPSEAFNYLLERAGTGDQLLLKWEVRCPECSRTLEITEQRDLINEYECNCGEEIEITMKDLYPVFQINPEYKAYIKDEKKKVQYWTTPLKILDYPLVF